MYNNHNVDAIILARKNSKRLLNKNVINYKGKMLFEWSIIQAIKSKIFSNIIVSSDSEKIIEFSQKIKEVTALKRDKYLSRSSTKSESVIEDLINNNHIKSEFFMLLQPTSPDRRVYDIKKCYFNSLKLNLDSLISLSDKKNIKKFNKSCYLYKNSKFNFINKKNIYFFNGSIYLVKTKHFVKYKTLYSNNIQYAHFMPKKFSRDIDTKKDLKSNR